MKTLMIGLLAALTYAGGVEAAPRARVRDVVIHAGWTWGLGPSKTFTSTLVEAVNEGLEVCASGQDLRLDFKIERLTIRQFGDIDLNRPNRLVAQVKVRRASDMSVIDLQRIDVSTPDEGLMAAVRDPELVLADATSAAVCGAFFASPPAPAGAEGL